MRRVRVTEGSTGDGGEWDLEERSAAEEVSGWTREMHPALFRHASTPVDTTQDELQPRTAILNGWGYGVLRVGHRS